MTDQFATTNTMPMRCPIHDVQMILIFYHRGKNYPVGNRWACPECAKTPDVEASSPLGAQQKMKSANIWRCIDCHKLDFYYGMTDQEIHDKHAKECDAREEVVLPPSKWPNGGDEGGAEL